MSRSVKEWVGKNDDTAVPPHVRLRVFDRFNQCCTICTRKIRAGESWTCEHVIAMVNWLATVLKPHGNRESNLGVTCCNCLPAKNAADVSQKSAVYQKRAKHILPKSSRVNGFRKAPPGFKFSWRTGRMESQ